MCARMEPPFYRPAPFSGGFCRPEPDYGALAGALPPGPPPEPFRGLKPAPCPDGGFFGSGAGTGGFFYPGPGEREGFTGSFAQALDELHQPGPPNVALPEPSGLAAAAAAGGGPFPGVPGAAPEAEAAEPGPDSPGTAAGGTTAVAEPAGGEPVPAAEAGADRPAGAARPWAPRPERGAGGDGGRPPRPGAAAARLRARPRRLRLPAAPRRCPRLLATTPGRGTDRPRPGRCPVETPRTDTPMGTPRTWMDPEGRGAPARTRRYGAPRRDAAWDCARTRTTASVAGWGVLVGTPVDTDPCRLRLLLGEGHRFSGGTQRGLPPQHGPGGAGDPRWRTPKGPVRMGDPWTCPPPPSMDQPEGTCRSGHP
ncbi:basic proline-rich protein-like isoform X2 [Aquila chrysaetos chrysaetos]|nr:basic proline-rich protein-like isoform X2 [Aquila chrysaetos chrysaetos]